jgi:RecA-family ATPase
LGKFLGEIMEDVTTEVREENFPPELKERRQWVLWKYEEQKDSSGNLKLDENGKPKLTKIPKQPNGFNAQSNNPQTWSSFDEVKTAYMVSDTPSDGVGFMFAAADPLTGIDFDNCIKEDGTYTEIVQEFLDVIPGWAEKSPSGKGIHLITRASVPRNTRKFTKDKKHTLFEIYGQGQFFTMTGNTINCHGTIPDTVQDISALVEKHLPETSSQPIQISDDDFENYKPPIQDWPSAKIKTELLDNIDPDISYPDWINVGMALHHQFRGSDEGLALFEQWSMQGSKYSNGECARKWPTFNNRKANSFTLASVIKLYKKQQKEKAKQEAQAPVSPIRFADIGSLAHTNPPDRKWVVDNWIPDAATTSFYGKGGIGKSILMQQLSIAVATGTKFLGLDVTQGPVLGFFCEEDDDEIKRRSKSIFDEMLIDVKECPDINNLYLAGRAGFQNIFAHFDNDASHYTTEIFKEFEKAVEQIQPKLIILDNLSHVFGGNEIFRSHVTSFVNIITSIAKRYDCSIILVGHVAKLKDSEFSGSTAWDAAVRTRLLLNRKQDGTTLFSKAKSNLSKEDELTIELRNTVFKVVTPVDIEQEKKILADKIKRFIWQKTKQQESTSNKHRSPNNVINMMVREEQLSESKKKLAKEVLNELIATEEILVGQELGWKDSSRHPVKGLKIRGKE